MACFLYNLLLVISLPGALLYYAWRVLVARKADKAWRHNLGALPVLADRPREKKLVWIHAASVGEVVATLPVLDKLKASMPDCTILLSTVTQTGNTVARNSAKCADVVCYLPLDYLPFVNLAVSRVRPDAFVCVEAEIWPNLLFALAHRRIPTIMINGRVSDRTMRRAKWWGWLMSWAISNIGQCCMQTKSDAERMVVMGARPESVKVTGSTKFDQDGCQLVDGASAAIRADLRLPEGVPVFVAGSTNPGEDEPVIAAFTRMRETSPQLRMIIAPRQIDRGAEVRALVEGAGFRCSRRSEKPVGEEFDALVLDTYGELATVYGVADVTFVGGSLIPKGGHSIIQPILQGKPVLFGPHTFKTRDVARMAIAAGVGFEVSGSEELGALGAELLGNRARLTEIASLCRAMVAENRGASTRCADAIMGSVLRPVETTGV